VIAREITFDHLTLQHYRAVFHNSMFVNSIWTSIFASATAVLILIPLGFACAFALRYDAAVPKPLRWLIEVLVTVPVAVPASLMGFGVLFAYTPVTVRALWHEGHYRRNLCDADDRALNPPPARNTHSHWQRVPRSIQGVRCEPNAFFVQNSAADDTNRHRRRRRPDIRSALARIQRFE
jgi:hypothetical protein